MGRDCHTRQIYIGQNQIPETMRFIKKKNTEESTKRISKNSSNILYKTRCSNLILHLPISFFFSPFPCLSGHGLWIDRCLNECVSMYQKSKTYFAQYATLNMMKSSFPINCDWTPRNDTRFLCRWEKWVWILSKWTKNHYWINRRWEWHRWVRKKKREEERWGEYEMERERDNENNERRNYYLSSMSVHNRKKWLLMWHRLRWTLHILTTTNSMIRFHDIFLLIATIDIWQKDLPMSA